ncbi:class I SAM-dependent methyltransferase [bacterium]|nr:class I SAM-dependent methyltransferase [bacterium]MCI0606676.1 class I SAM-dependent methyltransferase [bacterium]
MATDLKKIIRDLTSFYDFKDKIVVAVGAGGGQLADYGRATRQVIAVDRDEAELERLLTVARDQGLADKFTLVPGDFLTLQPTGDLVLFEFSLHEMPDPERALAHAATLAPDVLVIDHASGSPWSWYACEERSVITAWTAVAGTVVRRQFDAEGFQHFRNYAELEAKIAHRGPRSLERISHYRGNIAITIPMPYRLTLI